MKYAIRTVLAIAVVGYGVYALHTTSGTPNHQCAQRAAELENRVAMYEQAHIVEVQEPQSDDPYDHMDDAERVRGDAEASR